MSALSRRQFLRRSTALLAAGAALGALSCAPLTSSVPVASASETPAVPPTATPILASPVAAPLPPRAAPPTSHPTANAPRALAPAPRSPTIVPTGARPTVTPGPVLRQPNVVLISIDTLRSDRLGAFGFANAHTPTLDRLAAEGARFTRAICQLPQTNASHAALLTGLYPSTNGVKIHMVDKIRPGLQTMASVFAGAGYETVGIYSWVSLDPQFCGLNAGFQSYAGYVINRSLLFSDPRVEGLLALYRDLKAQVPVIKTIDVVSGGSDAVERSLDGRADVTTAAVLDWLDKRNEKEPFFLWAHYFDPHYPYAPPSGYDHLFGLKYQGKIDGSIDTLHAIGEGKLSVDDADLARLSELYQGEIAFADAQLGRVFDALRQRGIEDDTVVAIAADHGESFGEHGDWTHGLEVYETEIHVPVILRFPRKVPAGQVISAPVQLIDVMPTLLDLTGIRAPKPVQGASFAPLISPTKGTATSPRYAFTELADESFNSVVSTEWKLIRNNANEEVQLYHISQDEAEKRNLATDNPATTRELNARLSDLMKISGVSK